MASTAPSTFVAESVISTAELAPMAGRLTAVSHSSAQGAGSTIPNLAYGGSSTVFNLQIGFDVLLNLQFFESQPVLKWLNCQGFPLG
jgi:hypothetical protein